MGKILYDVDFLLDENLILADFGTNRSEKFALSGHFEQSGDTGDTVFSNKFYSKKYLTFRITE